jgi:HAT1-interacting factor 1
MAEATQPTQAPEAAQDKRVQLDDLIARAAAKDATKDHNSASELYSQATELQAELNGELSPENADLLYAYGKSLYNVAVSKSDVLGSKVAGEPAQSAPSASATPAGSAGTGENLVKDAISNAMTKNAPSGKEESTQSEAAPSKPFFQFTGDENFVDSDSDDEENGEAGEEEEEDDFANAFEVLDLARILYLKKLDAAEENNNAKGKSAELPADLKHIKERLADTYDLQAEISLEAERFSDAVTDLRTALDLRHSLFPFEDPSVAECHFKLSLALEFASVPQQGDDDGEKEKTVDEEMRKEAATQMERAIESCKIRMAQEEKKLEVDKDMDEDKVTATKRKIANVKEIVADMEQRVSLTSPPRSVDPRGPEANAFCSWLIFDDHRYRSNKTTGQTKLC